MAKKAAAAPADTLALYEKLVATNPDIERKGATLPYTSLDGHMFSFLTETGTLALRLPDAQREAFLKKYKTRLCERHGMVMKEYVEVPDALLRKTGDLQPYFAASVAYAASLKAKSTAKTKSAGTKKPAKMVPPLKKAKRTAKKKR